MAMVSDSTGQTSAFTPISSAPESQTTAVSPAFTATPAATAPPIAQAAYQQSPGTLPHQESTRGAVLGWLAATLMLIIVAAFIWSNLISDATRDRITGIF